MMREFMIDIETLDVTASAVVLSIGAVQFDDDGIEPSRVFHEALDIDVQLKHGRTVSQGTLDFWSQQSDAARAKVLGSLVERLKPVTALERLRTFLRVSVSEFVVWAKGTDFDIRNLDSLYTLWGLQPPWRYNAARDLRTLIYEAERLGPYLKPLRDTQLQPEHDALADCIFQVRELQVARAHLRHGRLA